MIEKKIQQIINEKVVPYLKQHGGNIKFLGIEDGIVKVKLLGQCSGCASSQYTVENVVKASIKEEIPEVKDVELINISEETLDIARKILSKSM